MRSLLPIIALISCALAAPPAHKPQLIIEDHDPKPLFESAPKPGLITAEHAVVETNQTIYTYLSQQLKYTKLIKLVDFDETYVTILNSTTDKITFFAPDNDALTPHKKKDPHDSSISLATLYEEYEQMKQLDDDDDDDEEKKKRFKKILHALLKYHTLPTALGKPELYKNATYATALKAKDGSFDGQHRRISVATGNWLLGSLYVNYYAKVEWISVSAENGYIYGVNHPIVPFPSILDELFYIDELSTFTSALQKVGLEDQLQWRTKAFSETEGDGPVVSAFAPTNKAWKKLPLRVRFYLFPPIGEKALKKLLEFHIVPNYILHSDWLHNATSDEDLTSAREQLKHECTCGGDWYSDLKGVHPYKHRHSKNPTVKQTLKDKIITLFRTKLNLKRSTGEVTYRRCRIKDSRLGGVIAPAPINAWPRHPPPKVTVNTTVPTLLDDHDLRFVVIKPGEREHHTFALPVPSDNLDKPSHALPPFFRSAVLANGVPAEVELVARNGALYSIGSVIHPKKEQSQEPGEIDNSWDDWEEWLPAWAEEE